MSLIYKLQRYSVLSETNSPIWPNIGFKKWSKNITTMDLKEFQETTTMEPWGLGSLCGNWVFTQWPLLIITSFQLLIMTMWALHSLQLRWRYFDLFNFRTLLGTEIVIKRCWKLNATIGHQILKLFTWNR